MGPQKRLKWISYSMSAILFFGLVYIVQKKFIHQKVKAKAKPHFAVQAKPVLDEDSMQMVIKGKLAEIQKCYDTELEKKTAKKAGILVIRWLVNAQGEASGFTEETNEMDSPELYDCATTAIQAWNFPKNRPTMIRYTFRMHALEREKIIREISSADDLLKE